MPDSEDARDAATNKGSSLDEACDGEHRLTHDMNAMTSVCVDCGLSAQSIQSQFPDHTLTRV